MKTQQEIQRAHDFLVGIIVEDVNMELSEHAAMLMRAQADVLCWVLEHDHNVTFQECLNQMEKVLLQRGYKLTDHGN